MDESAEGNTECNVKKKLPAFRVQLRLSGETGEKKVAPEEKWKDVDTKQAKL